MEEGQCRDWGNPIAEMMYETLRYFTGKTEATPSFIKNHGNTTYDDDTALNLPFNSTWSDPYVKTTTTLSNGTKVTKGSTVAPNRSCLCSATSTPIFDTDQLPGIDSKFGTGLTSNDLTGFNAKTLADAIAAGEKVSGSKYIGQNGSSFDGIYGETITGLGDIRGLCPEEPTKQGGYYSAAVAYYGHITDLNAASREQKKSQRMPLVWPPPCQG